MRRAALLGILAVAASAGALVALRAHRTPVASAAPTPAEPPRPAPAVVLALDAGITPRTADNTFDVTFHSGPYALRGFVARPDASGPFPAVVYNHGSEKDPDSAWMGDIADWFRSHGLVAFFPFRRGAGGSEGPYWEDVVNERPEAERHAATVQQLEAQSDDVLAAIEWIATRPYVDAAHIAVAGCSFGGIETVLAAERSTRPYAAVDFAGASMSWAGSPLLQERMKRAVRSACVPVFFAQAANDFDTTPSLALSEEMDTAGKPYAVKIFPKHGKTAMAGHAHFCMHGMDEWGPDVLAFLSNPPVR